MFYFQRFTPYGIGKVQEFLKITLCYLIPLIWYMLFALALFLIWKTLRISHLIIIALIISQSYLLFVETEEMKYSKFNTPTFKEFYATELFSDIKNYIGRNQKDYRVV